MITHTHALKHKGGTLQITGPFLCKTPWYTALWTLAPCLSAFLAPSLQLRETWELLLDSSSLCLGRKICPGSELGQPQGSLHLFSSLRDHCPSLPGVYCLESHCSSHIVSCIKKIIFSPMCVCVYVCVCYIVIVLGEKVSKSLLLCLGWIQKSLGLSFDPTSCVLFDFGRITQSFPLLFYLWNGDNNTVINWWHHIGENIS